MKKLVKTGIEKKTDKIYKTTKDKIKVNIS